MHSPAGDVRLIQQIGHSTAEIGDKIYIHLSGRGGSDRGVGVAEWDKRDVSGCVSGGKER